MSNSRQPDTFKEQVERLYATQKRPSEGEKLTHALPEKDRSRDNDNNLRNQIEEEFAILNDKMSETSLIELMGYGNSDLDDIKANLRENYVKRFENIAYMIQYHIKTSISPNEAIQYWTKKAMDAHSSGNINTFLLISGAMANNSVFNREIKFASDNTKSAYNKMSEVSKELVNNSYGKYRIMNLQLPSKKDLYFAQDISTLIALSEGNKLSSPALFNALKGYEEKLNPKKELKEGDINLIAKMIATSRASLENIEDNKAMKTVIAYLMAFKSNNPTLYNELTIRLTDAINKSTELSKIQVTENGEKRVEHDHEAKARVSALLSNAFNLTENYTKEIEHSLIKNQVTEARNKLKDYIGDLSKATDPVRKEKHEILSTLDRVLDVTDTKLQLDYINRSINDTTLKKHSGFNTKGESRAVILLKELNSSLVKLDQYEKSLLNQGQTSKVDLQNEQDVSMKNDIGIHLIPTPPGLTPNEVNKEFETNTLEKPTSINDNGTSEVTIEEQNAQQIDLSESPNNDTTQDSILTEVESEPVLFISDKDDTLVGEVNGQDGQLLDIDFTRNIAQIISTQPNTHFAIASKGGNQNVRTNNGYDTTVTQLVKENTEIDLKEPIMPQITGVASLIQHVDSSNIIYDKYTDSKEPPKTYTSKESQELALQRYLKFDLSKLDEDHIKLLDKSLDNTTWTLKFGDTLVTFSAEECNKHGGPDKQLKNGDFKFFSILMALDSAKLKLDTTNDEVMEKLKSFGITDIKSPDNYQTIKPSNIIFLDDNKDSVDLIQEAGFTCIHADTQALHNRLNGEIKRLDKQISEYQTSINNNNEKLIRLDLHETNPTKHKKLIKQTMDERNKLIKKIGFDPEMPENTNKRITDKELNKMFIANTHKMLDLKAYTDPNRKIIRKDAANNAINNDKDLLSKTKLELDNLRNSIPSSNNTYQNQVITAMQKSPILDLKSTSAPNNTTNLNIETQSTPSDKLKSNGKRSVINKIGKSIKKAASNMLHSVNLNRMANEYANLSVEIEIEKQKINKSLDTKPNDEKIHTELSHRRSDKSLFDRFATRISNITRKQPKKIEMGNQSELPDPDLKNNRFKK